MISVKIIIKKITKKMSRYVKETPRINIKFIDSDTEETLFEVKDRNPTMWETFFRTIYQHP